MATYSEWNNAIAKYFVNGMPNGATVYLGVDEAALMDIGARFKQCGTNEVNWVEDFREAVRSKYVIGDEVKFPSGSSYQSDQIPNCVAFLAAMVLAAHHMIKEDTKAIAENDYFKRLREVLGLPIEDGGRPIGLLTPGVEEVLWQIWNLWLIGNGWLHSAERGQHGRKFINYPLSQALLRESDKRSIELRFREKEQSGELGRVWDRDTVGTWTRKQIFGAKHLSELLQEGDFRRYDVITDAIYDVYISIDWDQEMETEHGNRSFRQRRLTAHLYRDEDRIMGSIDYLLYPRQLKQAGGETLEIIQNENTYLLREERQGWFMPLWSVNPAGGEFYEVKGHPQIKELVLPERKFWILVRDPEEASDGLAGWRQPELGETFLLLCRKEYEEQMEIFKQEALLEWDQYVPINDEWVEYRECMVVSPSWEGIIPQRQDLYDALKLNVSATISLKGGLRVPNQGGWLEGYAPEMTIIAFDDNVNLKLLDISLPDKPIMHQLVDTNKPISVPSLCQGVYLLEAYSLGKLAARRVLRILPWDSIECSQPKKPFDVDLKTFTLRGTIIKMNEIPE